MGPRVEAVLVEVRLPRSHRPRAARRVRVHRLRHDDLEPPEHVARRRLEDRHADAAHHPRLRTRDALVIFSSYFLLLFFHSHSSLVILPSYLSLVIFHSYLI